MRPTEWNAFKYAAFVTLGGLVFGLDLGVISGTFGQLKEVFGIDDLQAGTIGAAPSIGAIVALFFAGAMCNKLGRKNSLIIIAALYLLSAIGSALAPSYMTLVAARFLGGLAFCSLAVASMYIGEIAPSHLRGRLVAMNQFNIVIGLNVAFLINYWIDFIVEKSVELGEEGWVEKLGLAEDGWRWMLGAEIPFALLWLVLCFLIPKSPRWLMSVGREAEAEKVLGLVSEASDVNAEMASIKRSVADSQGSIGVIDNLKGLFSRHARMATIIAMVIATVQPITGINAILTYAPLVFGQIGSSSPLLNTVWVGLVSLVANIAAYFLIDHLGRRFVVVFGLLWCAGSLGLVAFSFQQATYTIPQEAMVEVAAEFGEQNSSEFEKLKSVVGKTYNSDVQFMNGVRETVGEELANEKKDFLIGIAANINAGLVLFAILSFIAAYQFSIGPVTWVVLSEIFPTKLRGIAITGAQLIAASVSYLVQQFFPWQLSNMGARDIFLFYCVCVSVGLVILFAILPETKNKSLEEIEAVLAGKGSK